MNLNYKPSQFELFPGSPGSSQDAQKPRYLLTDLTLSLENIILLGIIFLMILLFAFSIGVEQGKKLVKADATEEEEVQAVAKPAKMLRVTNAQSKARPAATATSQKTTTLPKATKTAPLTPQSVYTVQVASFKSSKYAQEKAAQLKKKGYPTTIFSNGSLSIVCIGKFAELNQAKLFLTRFKNKHTEFQDCLVRRM